MDFLVNDLSLEGCFPDNATFHGAMQRMMAIRQTLRRFGRPLYCTRNLPHAKITAYKVMHQIVQSFSRDERHAIMQWFTQHGPFWEDIRRHAPDDWIECDGKIVTDTAVGEAAWCCLNGLDRGLASFSPSQWQFSPVAVDWITETSRSKHVDIVNFWDNTSLEAYLQALPAPMSSWRQLEALATTRYTNLTFAVDAFSSLDGFPFNSSAGQRLLVLLDILNRFKSCFDSKGERTLQGHEIYRDFFTGKKGDGGRGALFSDSSCSEKKRFEKEMTFNHPTHKDKTLFCPWHGKVQTPPLRIHFSWPIRADKPLWIVYIGPKITM